MHRTYAVLAVTLVALLLAPAALADPIAEQGRAIFEKNKDAVVTISVVVKQQFASGGMSGDDETETELTGTVIDETGLTVTALSETDPSALIKALMGPMAADMNMSAEVTDAKILARDGSEVPVRIVLRDPDLDLAFFRPVDALDEPMPFVGMGSPGEAEVMDQLFVLDRMGRVAARAHSLSLTRVQAVVERPRRFYVTEANFLSSSLGCPAFDADGNVVGVMVLRAMGVGGGGNPLNMLGGMMDGMLPIVLPTSDIAEVAAQAPSVDEVPAEEAAPEEAAAEEEAAE